MELQTKLEEIAKNLGAFYFGVADLSLARGGPLTAYEKKLVSEYPFAISIGVPLSLETVEQKQTKSLSKLLNYIDKPRRS